jgi:hypothetical protein
MYPGIGRHLDQNTIKNKGGAITGPMQLLPCGDLVLLEWRTHYFKDGSRPSKRYGPGTILRPNRKTAKKTNYRSTHQIYDDAYALERGATHAVRRYGVRSKERGTEIGDIAVDKQTLREYVVFLIRMGPHMEHVLKDLYLGMNKLAKRYGWMIDESKKKAAIQIIRGLIEKDSLGRKNIPAAAMSMGGAIWNLLEREEVIQWLSMYMDQKAVQTERLIDTHIDLYRRLWNLVGKDSAIETLLDQPSHETLPFRMKLKDLYDQFETVCLKPFVRNAQHTVRDIATVLDLLSNSSSYGYGRILRKETLTRLKEGIRWVFVLDALQREIIFPLSFLINDLIAQDRLKRRGTKKRPIKITTSLAPEKFADLAGRIESFEKRLGKCQSKAHEHEVLEHDVKEEVLGYLELAKAHIREGKWVPVKNDLDTIAGIL